MSGSLEDSQSKNIVLLGIGHTNAHVVQQWARDPIAGYKLICISRFPTAAYSGMLPGTLGGQFSNGEMRIDLRALATRAGADLVLADTNGLDLETGEIQFTDRNPIQFDVLSAGVGSMPAGWQQHRPSPLLVPVKPMQTFLSRLHSHLLGAERTGGEEPLRVAIVGGGVASVEIALCLQQQCEKRRPRLEVAIEIFTSGDHIAEGMRGRSVRRLEELLTHRGIAIRPGHRVTEVGQADIATEDGRRHRSDCVIWATGASAPPVLGRLGLRTDERGFLATSNTLQSLSDPRVFAVGDSGTIIRSPAPKAGVYAVRQSPILWHNLRALVDGGQLRTFTPQQDFLKLLNTGDGKVLLEYGWLTIHARWCWLLKTWIDKRFVRKFQHARASNSR